ncbi:uncharacterized protein [Eurosta solidaginis]|uniref:uncharacterized protein isoform X2 n=1 Tax=Eurosta solidaginis TaxID=178769 RepID=UPI0035308EF8
MKVKLLLALTLLTTFAFSSSVKVYPSFKYIAKRSNKAEQPNAALAPALTNKAENVIVREKSETQSPPSSATSNPKHKEDNVGKDVHKRGAYYNGGLEYNAHTAHATHAAYLPKPYAAHYGYNLNLPGATAYSNVAAHPHGHASPAFAHAPALAHAPTYAAHAPTYAARTPTFFKYPSASGYHLKHFAAGGAIIPVAAYHGGSTFGGTAVGLGAPSIGPVYTTSAVASSLPHAHVGTITHAVGTVAPAVASAAPVSAYVLRPGGAVVSSYNVNYPRYHQRPVVAVPQVTPVQNVAHVHPVQPVTHFLPVPAVAPEPVQPVHSVVQVQQTAHPFASIQPSHHYPHYFQTTFVQPQRIPVAVPAAPAQPLPAIAAASFSFSPAPTFPAIPTFPTAPALPAVPTVPVIPTIPAVPTPPSVPTPASNPNSIYPLGFHPPTQPQPTFVSIPVQPEEQFPPLGPLPGSQRPQGGSAEAAPQIPNAQPPQQPQPELPTFEGNEEPWKPMLSYGPPSFDRPALTLLPPHGSTGSFGSAPGEAAPAQQQHQQQQQYERQQQSGLFDNLSDSEIEHIFAQAANLAAQDTPHRHQHRTFSRY